MVLKLHKGKVGFEVDIDNDAYYELRKKRKYQNMSNDEMIKLLLEKVFGEGTVTVA